MIIVDNGSTDGTAKMLDDKITAGISLYLNILKCREWGG